MPQLSILICSLESRKDTFLPKILKQLDDQIPGKSQKTTIGHGLYYFQKITYPDVEVIVCIDNKSMRVGKKRNKLKTEAKGSYLCYVDDDDQVSDDYVSSITEVIPHGYDVICFGAIMYQNDVKLFDVYYSKAYARDKNDDANKIAYRLPNHLMAWKSRIAKPVMFDSKRNMGEDAIWAKDLRRRYKTEHVIAKQLYYYYFNTTTTETQNWG